MKRIYESGALHRDDDDPFSPSERDRKHEPQAMRSVPSTYLSRLVVPHRVRHWSISVDVTTPKEVYTVGEPVPFAVTMKNAMPFPITIPVRSPIAWDWEVDGLVEAAHVDLRNPPEEPHGFRFSRGERKQYLRRWHGMFQLSSSEWEPASPGEYTIGAGLNVDDAPERGLYGETTVRLVPE